MVAMASAAHLEKTFPEQMPKGIRECSPPDQLMWIESVGLEIGMPGPYFIHWRGVIRRRAIRYMRSTGKTRQNFEDLAAEKLERAGQMNQERLVREMCNEIYRTRHTPVPKIALEYSYWQARYCGWDVLAESDRDAGACQGLKAASSKVWLWWSELQLGTRRAIVELTQLDHIPDALPRPEKKKAMLVNMAEELKRAFLSVANHNTSHNKAL